MHCEVSSHFFSMQRGVALCRYTADATGKSNEAMTGLAGGNDVVQ
jgi:hypothetical protein